MSIFGGGEEFHFADLASLRDHNTRPINGWISSAVALRSRVEALANTDSIAGDSAVAMADYWRRVHVPLLDAWHDCLSSYLWHLKNFISKVHGIDSDFQFLLNLTHVETTQYDIQEIAATLDSMNSHLAGLFHALAAQGENSADFDLTPVIEQLRRGSGRALTIRERMVELEAQQRGVLDDINEALQRIKTYASSKRLGTPMCTPGGGEGFVLTFRHEEFPGLGEFFPEGVWDGKGDSFFSGSEEMVNFQIALLYARGPHTWRPWELDALMDWMVQMSETPEGLSRVVETFALAQRLQDDRETRNAGLADVSVSFEPGDVPVNHWQLALSALFDASAANFGVNALIYAWYVHDGESPFPNAGTPSRDATYAKLRLFQLLGYLRWQGGTSFNPADFNFDNFHFNDADPARFYVGDKTVKASDLQGHFDPDHFAYLWEAALIDAGISVRDGLEASGPNTSWSWGALGTLLLGMAEGLPGVPPISAILDGIGLADDLMNIPSDIAQHQQDVRNADNTVDARTLASAIPRIGIAGTFLMDSNDNAIVLDFCTEGPHSVRFGELLEYIKGRFGDRYSIGDILNAMAAGSNREGRGVSEGLRRAVQIWLRNNPPV
ncbi:MAG: LXG domain-containing protein [Promicromonosporaceae bacterium]|nr:LXG domain-containing protein [Promicromonosporaceae bacterium]